MASFPSDFDPLEVTQIPCVDCEILSIGQVPHRLRDRRIFDCACGRYWLQRHIGNQAWEELDAIEFELWRKDFGRFHPSFEDSNVPREAIG